MCQILISAKFLRTLSLRLVHMYDASISTSTSTSTRKSMCEPGQRKHKCKHKKKKKISSSYTCTCACVTPVHTYFFLCLHLCLCLCRTCEPAFTEETFYKPVKGARATYNRVCSCSTPHFPNRKPHHLFNSLHTK